MEIRINSLIEGAEQAEGTAVIIDVYRAFTTASVVFSRGAEKILFVSEVPEALELRDKGLADICIGEVRGIMPDQFDFGNSPYHLSNADVTGKTVVQRTSAGTRGVEVASMASDIYVAALINSAATVKSILQDEPDLVTLVAMGDEGLNRTDEDEQCALYIRNLLEGNEVDIENVRSLVLAGSQSRKYEDLLTPHFHPRDREIALSINECPFAIHVQRDEKLLIAQPIYPREPTVNLIDFH